MSEQRFQSIEASLRELLKYEKDRVGMQKDIERIIEMQEEDRAARAAFQKATDERLKMIETAMPSMQLVSKGVIWAAMGILAAAVTLVWKAAQKVLSTTGF